VLPPCRLILLARLTSYRMGRRAEFAFQGFVRDRMVFSGTMIGVPIHVGDHVGSPADE
jgi:3-hydroxyacyl-[acyl-carrier-protein] dehydratase